MYEENKINIAETIFKNAPKPIPVFTDDEKQYRVFAVPDGWNVQDCDTEKLLPTPRRKRAIIELTDDDSFIAYITRHGIWTNCTIWADVDYAKNQAKFQAIINDHGEAKDKPEWRDHIARYTPRFSPEFALWMNKNKQTMSQVEFAEFLETNQIDIASPEGFPTSADMLQMSLNFEAKQDLRFKSKLRLQNGGVEMVFVNDEDKGTTEKMKVFDRFALGIPVYFGGTPYQINARLRYRVRDGEVTFWYELIRPDLVMKDATETIIKKIRESCEQPFFFGNPFAA